MTTYTTPAVCAAAGATFRELDYWIRRGYLTLSSAPQSKNGRVDARRQPEAPGSGYARRWSVTEAVRVILIKRAVRAGFTLVAAAELAAGDRHLGGIQITYDIDSIPQRRCDIAELRRILDGDR